MKTPQQRMRVGVSLRTILQTAFALCCLTTLSPSPLHAQQPSPPFSDTVQWSLKSIDEARTELAATRAKIANQQRPQIQELSRIQTEVTALRSESKQLAFETQGIKHGIEQLATRVQSGLAKQESSQHRLLYLRRKFEENLPAIERPAHQPAFLALEQTGAATADERLAQLKALFAIADAAIDRIDSQIGGHRFDATALVDSVATEGQALQFGPYAFFSPQGGAPGMIVEGEDLIARLRQHSPDTERAIADAIAGRETFLPFDPLFDQAFLNADAEVTLWEHLKSGGLWIIPITFFGLVSTIIALLKFLQIRGVRIPEKEQIIGLVNADEKAAFDRQLEAITPSARPIFAEGFAYRQAPEVARAAAMSQVLLAFRSHLESRLSLLALTAAVAPLLGLLGTVTGMIKTFQVISLHGAGDARTLSGGISEALVTTELGLVVAIPALLAHAWLNRRAKRISVQTSSLAERFHKTLPPTGAKP